MGYSGDEEPTRGLYPHFSPGPSGCGGRGGSWGRSPELRPHSSSCSQETRQPQPLTTAVASAIFISGIACRTQALWDQRQATVQGASMVCGIFIPSWESHTMHPQFPLSASTIGKVSSLTLDMKWIHSLNLNHIWVFKKSAGGSRHPTARRASGCPRQGPGAALESLPTRRGF